MFVARFISQRAKLPKKRHTKGEGGAPVFHAPRADAFASTICSSVCALSGAQSETAASGKSHVPPLQMRLVSFDSAQGQLPFGFAQGKS